MLWSIVLGIVGVLVLVAGILVFHGRSSAPEETVASTQASAEAEASASSSPPVQSAEPAPQVSEEVASSSASSSSTESVAAAAVAEVPKEPAPRAPAPHKKHTKVAAHSPRHTSSSAGAAASVPAAPVKAAQEEDTVTVVVGARRDPNVPFRRVRLGDLDLNTDKGACTALRRIKRAAEDVCPYGEERPLELWKMHKECIDESLNRAVEDTHSPRIQKLKRSNGC